MKSNDFERIENQSSCTFFSTNAILDTDIKLMIKGKTKTIKTTGGNKMNAKKVVCLVSAAAMAMGLAGGTTAVYADEKEGYKIAFVNCSLNETWRVQMVAEFEQAADELKEQGVISEYYETNADNDASKQVSDMRDMIAKGVDGILIATVNPTASNGVIKEAMDAGIKVVNYNSLADTDNVTAKVYQSDKDFGRIGAEFIVDKIDGKGKIIVLNGTAGNSVSNDRWQGAEEVFSQYPDIEIVGEAYGEWDYAKGKAATESLLSANPEIDAVWSQGGAMTQGAVDAFVAAGRKLVPMSGEAGNGYIKTWIQYLGTDDFDSVAPNYTATISVTALNTLIDALDGKDVEFDQCLEMSTITSDDINDLYRDDLPDSFWCDTQLTEENLQKLFSE